ncbi:MAG: hypothetical protein L3J38_01350 [Thiomicrorhabdus sp.]|nr:hypothetical protein [Thiomicrorhabdus sp.]
MVKVLKIFLLMLMVTTSHAVPVSSLSKKFIGVPLLKIKPIAFSQYSKNEQVIFLIERARQRGRVSSVRSLWAQKKFTERAGGEKVLQSCLRDLGCKLENILKKVEEFKAKTGVFPSAQITQMIAKDDLYYQLAMKAPSATATQLKLKAGQVAEALMDKNFHKAGWVKLEGEVGRNGFDGLYVKLDKNKNVKKNMIVESKYGEAMLKNTVDGSRQMSKQWSLKKVDALIKKYPDNLMYKEVREYILKDETKYRIYRLRAKNNKLYQTIEKITPQEKTVSISKLSGNERYQANYTENLEIDLTIPLGGYQKRMVSSYTSQIR